MTKDISNLEIKIYPLILEKDVAGTLWHLLRAIDSKGQGMVCITMSELKKYMDCSRATVYRHMKSPLFRRVIKNKDGSYKFFIQGIKKVKEQLGIADLTTMSLGHIEHIRKDKKKQTIAEILIADLQRKSFFKALKVSKGRSIISLEEVFKTSNRLKGVFKNRHQVCYNSDFYVPYGASQATVAKLLERTRQTVCKRLGNTESKKQQFTYSDIELDRELARQEVYSIFPNEDGYNQAAGQYNRYIQSGKDKTVFKKYCNLYNVSGWELRVDPKCSSSSLSNR